jgi:hypothetical protein
MPNWCENWLEIHSKSKPIQDYFDDWRAKSQDPILAFSLTSFIPMPNGIWDYDWCLANWGTKWDVDSPDVNVVAKYHGLIQFVTAWSPPLKVIEALSRSHPELEIVLDFGEPNVDATGRLAGSAGVTKRTKLPDDSAFSKWYRDMFGEMFAEDD